jgi:hypothetical protein
MIEESRIDKKNFHFILIRENKIAAYIQRGNNDGHVIAEITHIGEFDSIRAEIESTLLSEPWSAEMEWIGNWENMKNFCYASANLYGKFLWAYFDQESNNYECGFDVSFIVYSLD